MYRYLTATNWTEVMGPNRDQYLDLIWSLYQKSYTVIGEHLSGPKDLLKYTTWAIFESEAFILWRSTVYGYKIGLLGSDGSSRGKTALVQKLNQKLNQPGFYIEASGAVERVTTAIPVVCNGYVSEILGRIINPSPDGVHYTRDISRVGRVEKILTGHPNGIPVTDRSDPNCPVLKESKLTEDDRFDFLEHQACNIDIEEDDGLDFAEHLACNLDLEF